MNKQKAPLNIVVYVLAGGCIVGLYLAREYFTGSTAALMTVAILVIAIILLIVVLSNRKKTP